MNLQMLALLTVHGVAVLNSLTHHLLEVLHSLLSLQMVLHSPHTAQIELLFFEPAAEPQAPGASDVDRESADAAGPQCAACVLAGGQRGLMVQLITLGIRTYSDLDLYRGDQLRNRGERVHQLLRHQRAMFSGGRLPRHTS